MIHIHKKKNYANRNKKKDNFFTKIHHISLLFLYSKFFYVHNHIIINVEHTQPKKKIVFYNPLHTCLLLHQCNWIISRFFPMVNHLQKKPLRKKNQHTIVVCCVVMFMSRNIMLSKGTIRRTLRNSRF